MRTTRHVALTLAEAGIVRKVFASIEALGQQGVIKPLTADEYAVLVKVTEALADAR